MKKKNSLNQREIKHVYFLRDRKKLKMKEKISLQNCCENGKRYSRRPNKYKLFDSTELYTTKLGKNTKSQKLEYFKDKINYSYRKFAYKHKINTNKSMIADDDEMELNSISDNDNKLKLSVISDDDDDENNFSIDIAREMLHGDINESVHSFIFQEFIPSDASELPSLELFSNDDNNSIQTNQSPNLMTPIIEHLDNSNKNDEEISAPNEIELMEIDKSQELTEICDNTAINCNEENDQFSSFTETGKKF